MSWIDNLIYFFNFNNTLKHIVGYFVVMCSSIYTEIVHSRDFELWIARGLCHSE